MLKLTYSLLLVLFSSLLLVGQTTDLGAPKSWTLKTVLQRADYHLMPVFDVQQLLQEDAINKATGVKTWRFGHEENVSYGLQNSGTWTTLNNGDRIWQIEFESSGALSMNFVFDNFNIPQGASLHLFNPQTKKYIGAYTSRNNNPDRMLGSSLLGGDNAIIEYYEPAAVAGQGVVNISMVVHAYKSLRLHPQSPSKALNSSGACNVDVNCPLGLGWQDQINSVALIIVGGSGNCTGALINNTRNDGTPYFLTANHCGTTGLGAWVFRFNWDSPTAICATTSASVDPGAPFNDVNGAVLRANNPASDFALMELNSAPTGNVYYAGWDRDTTPATSVTGIHHPRADVKKICRENAPVTKSIFGTSSAQVWQIADWDQGVTEGGSSGSPLFNQNKLIIGQLYGGGAACVGTTDNGLSDNYGRIDVSWSGTSVATGLGDWLDPKGLGFLSIAGYNPNGQGFALDAGAAVINGIENTYCNIDSFMPSIVIRNYGNDTITSLNVGYQLDGGINTTYNWIGVLLPNAIDTVQLPILTAANGSHTFYAYTSQPNGSLDSNSVNDTISRNFRIMLNAELVHFTLITDCYADETTWTLRDTATNAVLYSGGPYRNNFSTIDTMSYTFCLVPGCYIFTINDSYGDGLDGTSPPACGRHGNYSLTDDFGNKLVTMTANNGNFGTTASHTFCVPYVANIQKNIYSLARQFDVYPNPTSDNLNVNLILKEENATRLELYNATGQLLQGILNINKAQELYQFDMSSYSAGMYFVKLTIGDKVLAKKVVKQ